MAARHADVWHAWAAPAEFARKNAVLDGLCQDIGRSASDLARASGGTVAVLSGRRGESALDQHDVQGTAEEVLSQLLAFRDAGADEFIVCDEAASVPTEQAIAQISNLTSAVLPGLS